MTRVTSTPTIRWRLSTEMKTSIIDVPPRTEYPCLKKFENDQGQWCVVLFKSFFTGTVVHVGSNGGWLLGDHSNSWIEDEFKPFAGAVSLSDG